MNKIDKIIINTLGILLLLAWTNYFIDSFVEALFVAFLLYILFKTVIVHSTNRFKNKKTISFMEMSKRFAIMGGEKTAEHFAKTLPIAYNPQLDNTFVIYEKKEKKILLAPLFKFSNISMDDIAKVWRYAEEKDFSTIQVIGANYQRSVLLFSYSLSDKFIFYPARQVQKYLATRNALPTKNYHRPKNVIKIDFRQQLSQIFIRKRAKLFLFSGLALAILSFFTPLRAYYLVMSTISIGMSIACLVADRS
ncbi:MAG: hypothetical protein QM214_00440 [Bacillota bacterium]|nr:hypothetical protein [Bacillota bacterium]HHU43595.1 hypothetical protein [Clostridiales bacterium]